MREAEAAWAGSSRHNLRLDPAQASHTVMGWGGGGASFKWLLPALLGVTCGEWGRVAQGLTVLSLCAGLASWHFSRWIRDEEKEGDT